ncbi:MAG TPA: Ig-like domain-containing protein [Anaeromyxobacteraceae bacterium]|nr:Ig-like domain-containing protein [Anaeromyxobacteraceae bacterium]
MLKRRLQTVAGMLAVGVALAAPGVAWAALLDAGPADPVLVFPRWYRDFDGTVVGLCRSQVRSPNPAAGLGTMCFPLAPDPAGFEGNLGPELFYNDLTVAVGAPLGGAAFGLRYTAALEATYLPGPTPVHRQEGVFARIRIEIDAKVPGTYTVTHPFGVEVFPDVLPSGPHSVFYTRDVPLGVPGDFTSALAGPIGPFIQWDVVNAGETLSVGGDVFLGDPNYAHTFTGSPFGTNFVRVDGPPGSNLDGAGNDFVVRNTGSVVGQRFLAPIATGLEVESATYARSGAAVSADVWATSAPAQKLVLASPGLPSVRLAEFPGGRYYGHVEWTAPVGPPAAVTVTNLTSVPVAARAAPLTDRVNVSATFSSATGALDMAAATSDGTGPALVVEEPFGGAMTPGVTPGAAFSHVLLPAGTEPPRLVHVRSAAGGAAVSEVAILPGAPMNPPGPPVAVNDIDVGVAGAGPTSIPVAANDAFAGAPAVLVLSQPQSGSVVPGPGGTAVYTPAPGASGPDGFTYALEDAVGISNVASVTFTVPFVPLAPTAVADGFAMLAGTTRALPVLANDVPASRTALDPASVLAVQGPLGVAAPNPDGTVAFTPPAGATGLMSFSYTVANGAGVRSAPASATVAVFPTPEVIALRRVLFAVSKRRWSVIGDTTWFDPALTQLTVTCWLGAAVAPAPATLIGSAPVETSGRFAVVPPGTGPVPARGQAVTCQTSSGGVGTGAAVLQ